MTTRKILEISDTNPENTKSEMVNSESMNINDKNVLLAMWITCVEQAGIISQRRDSMTNWFMVLQGVLITAIATILKESADSVDLGILIIIICVIGIILNIVWIRLIYNFKFLNSAKYDVILEIEKKLPIQAMSDEWVMLTTKTKYKNHTFLELALPLLFGSCFLVLIIIKLFLQ